MRPVRVQLSRAKGWRLPPNTVVVSRPSRHGNPFRVVPWGRFWGVLRAFQLGDTGASVAGFDELFEASEPARAVAVRLYRDALGDGRLKPDLASLRGKNLACWCPLDQPCHADVLLELANR